MRLFGLNRIRRFAGSTSVRLILGFVTILCVFGAALLIMLRNLDEVRNASEEARIRQETRQKALEVGRLAVRLFSYQYDFIQSEGVDLKKIKMFQDTYEEVETTLDALLERPLDQYERTCLQQLDEECEKLKKNFLNDIWQTKYHVVDGDEPEEVLFEMFRNSTERLINVNEWNYKLGDSLRARLSAAEFQAREAWEMSLSTSQAVLAVALVVSLVVTYYTHRSIVDPVNKLIAGTKTLASGDLSRRVEVRGSREFRELAEAFNKMTEALRENQQQLIQSEKLASIGRLAAGVAHEINNPIAVILGYARMMRARFRGRENQSEREAMESIEEEARQCKAIVEGLLDLSRPSGDGEAEEVNPDELVSEVLDLAQILQLTEQVKIEKDVVSDRLPLSMGRSKLRQIVLNIVYNALEELQKVEGARLAIRAFLSDGAGGEPQETGERGEPAPPRRRYLVFDFTDNGPGIKEEHLDHLFEPFFTTKGSGTGLGLAITYNIVRAHQGSIEVESEPQKGTTFTVTLPLSEEEEELQRERSEE